MKRYSGTGRFGGAATGSDEDINPMEGVANLADVMLVFACGLMLALITFWNVDVGGFADNAVAVDVGEQIGEIQGIDDNGENRLNADSELKLVGSVYQDADGNFYMISDD